MEGADLGGNGMILEVSKRSSFGVKLGGCDSEMNYYIQVKNTHWGMIQKVCRLPAEFDGPLLCVLGTLFCKGKPIRSNLYCFFFR